MKHESTDTIVVSLLKEAVESEGCHLTVSTLPFEPLRMKRSGS